ncbi:UNVERIFIED_CONTAM: hypothetical protein FKN15_064683 [Acipenser sinensis]
MPLRKPAPNPNLKPSRSEMGSKTALFAKKNFSFCQVSEEFLAKTGSPSRDVCGDAKNGWFSGTPLTLKRKPAPNPNLKPSRSEMGSKTALFAKKNFSFCQVSEEFLAKTGSPSRDVSGDAKNDTILNTALENYKSNVSERNEENNQTQVPEPITLCIDEAFVSVVTHVTSPDDFILQQLQNAKDNQWYRATVLSYTSKDKVCVGYIDFGNCEELNVDRIRPVTEKFLQLPMQAIPCALAGVKPLLGVWTPEAILIMKKLVSSKFLKAKVVGRKERKALIELCDEHSDPQASIAELLIATGYAAAAAAEEEERKKHKADSAVKTEDTAPTVPLPEKLEWTSAGLPDSQAVDVAVSVLHSPGEFYCQRYITRGIKPLEKDWTKDAIARFQALTRGTQPKVQVVSKNKSGFGIDMRWKEQNIASILVAEELAVAENANIAETPAAAPPDTPHTVDMQNLQPLMVELAEYCSRQSQHADLKPKAGVACCARFSVDMQNLQPLMVELAEYCSSQSHHAELKPKAGVACCARFSGDKNWYRAIVLETFDTTAKVIYADYGNSESVEYSSILPIQEKHLALPFQVVKCALAAQRESPGEWPQSSVEQFKTLVQGRKVFASVQEFDGELHTVNLKSCVEDGFASMALAVSLRLICTALLFQVMQCSTAVDVLFLLDGSYSIGKGSFERSKHFAFKLCDALDINPERVQVGVIQYSSTPRLEFSLNSYPTKDEVKERIKKLSFNLPTEQHVLFAEHFNDAVNGLYTTLTSATVCTAVPSDPCDSQPCHNRGTCIPDGLEKYSCVCPVGFGGDPNCAPKLSLDCSVDLLFLVEGSSNVSLEGFLRYKSFMRRFVQAVLTPDTPVNVGLAQYSDDEAQDLRAEGISLDPQAYE